MEELENMRPKLAGGEGGVAGGGKQKSGGGGVGKGKGKKQGASSLSSTAAAAAKQQEERLAATSMAIKVERMMCQAMMRLCLGLEWLDLLPSPTATRTFNTEKEQFVQRFSSFEQLIRPPPLTYEDFKRSTNPGEVTSQRVLLAAYEALVTAQSTISSLEASGVIIHLPEYQKKHIIGVKRIAAQNMMGIKLLLTSLGAVDSEKGGNVKKVNAPGFVVGWDFKVALQHSAVAFYPALVLKTRK
jgi:hypothetical protein